MLRSRNGAFLLMVVAVFWSAQPLSACLLAGHASDSSACCIQMAQDCPMQSADMSSPCCQSHSEDAAVIPDIPITSEHVRIAALAPHMAAGAAVAPSTGAFRHIPEAFPPGASPGATSVLRI